MRRSITIAAFAAGLAGAFALGSLHGGRASAPPAIERDAGPAIALPSMRVPPATIEVAPALSADQIRTIVREELADAHGAAPPAAEIDPAIAEAREQAFARAKQVIDHARSERTWTEEDRDRLRLAMGAIDREQAEAIFSELYPALNDGRIRLAYAGSPL